MTDERECENVRDEEDGELDSCKESFLGVQRFDAGAPRQSLVALSQLM